MEERKQEEHLEKFLRWATKLGITDSPQHNLCRSEAQSSAASCLGQSLYVSNFPEAGGRGLAAARDIRKNELILKVPKFALMTTKSLTAKDQKLACCIARHPHLSSTQILSVCLLAEMGKGNSSRWHPYLVQLPRHYDTLASFTEFEAQALQVDDATWVAERVITKAQSEWDQALPLMRELELKSKLLTFKAWLWASATVSSRTMHVPWDDAGCLCPVGDFFNYAAPGDGLFAPDGESSILQSNSQLETEDAQGKVDVLQHNGRLTDAGYDDDMGAYCFYARKNYRKREQVLLSYGTYTNLELLEHYGFQLDANPNEKVFIPVEPGIYSDSWPKESFYIQCDGRPSFALLSALRLWATPHKQKKSFSRLAYSGSQLSSDNEIIVMKWLVANCQVLLDRLPSSIEQDVLLLDLIDNISACPVHKIEQILLDCGDGAGGLGALFDGNKSKKCNSAEFVMSTRGRRSLERWKLAIQWRLRVLVSSFQQRTD